MKRKREVLLYIILILALSCFYIQQKHLYFSPEEVFYACERGLRSGPSEEIVFTFDTEDGCTVLVGKQEKGIFVVPAERTHLFFWRMASGGIDGFYRCEQPLNGYLTYDGNYLGLRRDERITELSIVLGNHTEENWKEYKYPVEEELIFIEAEQIFQDEGYDLMKDYIVYTEGRNAAGEVLFSYGDIEILRKVR